MAAPAKREISSNPSGNAVTAPTDPKLKADDIDRKMRLYGVVQAFRQGSLPSNEQIEETLKYVEGHSPVREDKLSKEGKKLIQDVRDIIATARKMVLKKNEDELFQNFVYHTRHIDTDKLNAANNVETSLSKEDAKRDGEQAAEHLRVLAKLIFTNAEFRKILKDVRLIAQDVAADAAQKAANTARPDEKRLDQVDETAPSNRWYGPEGQQHGPNDPVPDTGLGAKKDKLLEKKDQAVGVKEQVESHARDAADRAGNASQQQPGQEGQAAGQALAQKADEVIPDEHKETARQHASDATDRVDSAVAAADGPHEGVPRDGEKATNLTEDEQRAAKEAGKSTAKDKLNRFVPGIPDEHRETLNKKKDEAKGYLKDKIPEERRDRYQGHAKDVHAQTKDHAKGNIRGDPTYSKAELELRTLVERFANNTSCQPIIEAIDVIYTDAQNDPELQKWFSQLDKYVRKVLQEPGYIMKDQCNAEGRKLRDNAQGLFGERYRPHREALYDETEKFFTAFADDPINKKFGDSFKKLAKDLFLDSEGNLKYKSHLWNDVRQIIAPDLFKHLGYVPIPRIEYSDEQVDLVLENLTLESQNILPNLIEFEARTYHKLSPYDGIENKSKQSVWVQFSQVQADLRDVAFYVKRKSGFPRIKDHGVADVFCGGKGITGKIHLTTSSKRDAFEVKEVTVKIDTLSFKIRDSSHNVLYALLRPLATGLIKKQIAKAIQEGIRSGLNALNDQLIDIRDRLDEAAEDDDTSRLDVLKDVFNEKKEKARKAQNRASSLHIVAQKEDKHLDWSSGKDSMIEKQAERQKLAEKGTAWKSPAFDIVPGSHTDVKTKPKGIDGASNVPTKDYKKAHPDGAQVVSKPATEAGAAVTGVSAGAAASSSNQNGSSHTANNGQQSTQRESAAGAVSSAAERAGPLPPAIRSGY